IRSNLISTRRGPDSPKPSTFQASSQAPLTSILSSTSARLRRRRLADRASRSGRSRSILHLALSDTRIPVHGRGQPAAPPRACRFLHLASELHCCSRRVPAHREARSRQNAAGCCACTPTTTCPRARRSRQPRSRANSGE
ncbi:hypothetical protein PVAP13_6KG396806, partial [Panicum virgatum]